MDKASLARAARPPLPPAIADRPKTGFTTPVRQWLLESGAADASDRGLRGWARYVHRRYAAGPVGRPGREHGRRQPGRRRRRVTLLALLTDAYGGRGGIAKVNRDLLAAVVEHEAVGHVVVLPRGHPEGAEAAPAGVEVRAEAAGGAGVYLRAVAAEAARGGYDGVFCGHLHLAPLAALAAARAGVPWLLLVHGTEAWGPPHWPATQGAWAMRAGPRPPPAAPTTSWP